MSIATLYPVRHGQSVWSGTRRVTGQLDPPLSPRGEGQAQALADVLALADPPFIRSTCLDGSSRGTWSDEFKS